MKVRIKEVVFKENSELAQAILDWIVAQDGPRTVRQVFYGMVAQNLIDNTSNQYRRISTICTKLRQGGWCDWDWIIDTTRSRLKTQEYGDADACVEDALDSFRLDRWQDQPHYVEVWTEKRGLAVALSSTTNALDVYVCDKGGKSLITETAIASLKKAQDEGRENVILYVGDYDASGLKMDDNMITQLSQWGIEAVWERVALTYGQQADLERAYIVPATFTAAWRGKHPDVEIIAHDENGRELVNKLEKDGNAEWFREQHDGELFQVEVDAMPMADLRELVHTAITNRLYRPAYDEIVAEENDQREEMRERAGL